MHLSKTLNLDTAPNSPFLKWQDTFIYFRIFFLLKALKGKTMARTERMAGDHQSVDLIKIQLI